MRVPAAPVWEDSTTAKQWDQEATQVLCKQLKSRNAVVKEAGPGHLGLVGDLVFTNGRCR